jgi:hypothetical protein
MVRAEKEMGAKAEEGQGKRRRATFAFGEIEVVVVGSAGVACILACKEGGKG